MEDLDQSVAASERESRDLDQSMDPDVSGAASASSARFQDGVDLDTEYLEASMVSGENSASVEVGDEGESSLLEGSSGFRDESRDDLDGEEPSFG